MFINKRVDVFIYVSKFNFLNIYIFVIGYSKNVVCIILFMIMW